MGIFQRQQEPMIALQLVPERNIRNYSVEEHRQSNGGILFLVIN